MGKFPNYKQTNQKDCGPTCIKIIAKYYGKTINIQKLQYLSETTREGSSLYGLSEAAEKIGFHTIGIRISLEKLMDAPLPCILHWNRSHYVVLYKIKGKKLFVSDPAHGILNYSKDEFLKFWIGKNANFESEEGVTLLIEPTPKFYNLDSENNLPLKYNFSFISKYLIKYKKFLIQLMIGLVAGSLLNLCVPFLTQSIVDIGIQNQDINFIYLILIAQLFLFLGRTALEVIRGWILLHLSTRINISLISDFFIKLMHLPIAYFDTKMTGDILQRINDHDRIEKLLTTSSLNILFSMINLIIFGLVLAFYSLEVFVIFLLGTFFYLFWLLIFLKKRKDLDYKRFSEVSQEQSKVIELINGMQEIKLHNAERQMRWSWEYVQARIFKINLKSLALEQTQTVGSTFINELKNILISVLSAKLVIAGDISLGMMLAISYIVGQLNGPVAQLITFFRDAQDAKISLDRLAEIHNQKDEDEEVAGSVSDLNLGNFTLRLRNVSFRYIGGLNPVIKKLNLTIPENKITAIVGVSGSGKTTLMKLLLKFYDLSEGEITVGNNKLKNISQKKWRQHCGVVMQEGYIFNTTIARNIAIGKDNIDMKRLSYAANVANIREYIDELPLGFNTKIGLEGIGLSTGQKQRLLIARAVYKDPDILFFDEATSALDANNEKTIMENLNVFFRNKTVIIIAHRLSTVKNAHQIVLLDKGKIIEVGSHQKLTSLRGGYYNLVRNQLELGS